MSALWEQAQQKVAVLPPEEQDAIASRVLDTLADKEAWQKFFEARRGRFEQLAAEALDEHERGLTQPLDKLLD